LLSDVVDQRENETFYHKFTAVIPNSITGTLSFALDEVRKPEVKETRSALMANTLRLGDPENYPLEALEIMVKTSKCTALARPKAWKRFAPRESNPADEMDVDTAPTRDHYMSENELAKIVWAQLRMRTEFHVEHGEQEDEDKGEEDNMDVDGVKKSGAKVEKEQLVRGFKYGSSYVPCPDGQFAKLDTRMGISICGFFSADNVCLPFFFIFCMMTPVVSERTLHGRGPICMGRSSFTSSASCALIACRGYGQAQHVCNHSVGQQGHVGTKDGSARPVSVSEC
jgi:Ku70/Ku80 beta-barrel domain